MCITCFSLIIYIYMMHIRFDIKFSEEDWNILCQQDY